MGALSWDSHSCFCALDLGEGPKSIRNSSLQKTKGQLSFSKLMFGTSTVVRINVTEREREACHLLREIIKKWYLGAATIALFECWKFGDKYIGVPILETPRVVLRKKTIFKILFIYLAAIWTWICKLFIKKKIKTSMNCLDHLKVLSYNNTLMMN